jgi:hypothetical protein
VCCNGTLEPLKKGIWPDYALNDCQGVTKALYSPVLDKAKDKCLPSVVKHANPARFVLTISAPHPCHPLRCDRFPALKGLKKVDSDSHLHTSGTFDTHQHEFPKDLKTDIEKTEDSVTFSNFRDFYTDTCADYMGSRKSDDPVF